MAYPIPIQVSVNLRSKDFPPYEFPPRVFPSSDLWSSVLRAHGLPREVLHPGHYYIKKCRGNGPTASVSDTVEKIRTQYAKTDANNICVRVVRNETFRSPAPLSGRFSMRSPPRRSRRRAQFYPPAQGGWVAASNHLACHKTFPTPQLLTLTWTLKMMMTIANLVTRDETMRQRKLKPAYLHRPSSSRQKNNGKGTA
ncbi:uncharacterized protein LOC110860898 isoform X3 [Folsomia candida]|uniref:uncharacterized protein LOC110860898 isoform X3 n=1 Tax=Folsomia candida TaxID=158441 RepID=UPI0016055C8B|nr:uncharacterized protein LOC110860898 isoform X3 [Folsomia candida]